LYAENYYLPAPINVTCHEQSETSIEVTWEDDYFALGADVEKLIEYEVYITNKQSNRQIFETVRVRKSGPSMQSFSFHDLLPGNLYTLGVASCNINGVMLKLL